MLTKRLLILLPLVLLAVLFQSFFWVPRYDRQTVGNPARLRKFIDASIGDASHLNPVVSADGSSSSVNQFVFDSLLDFDENLKLKPALAERWTITENAYLAVRRERIGAEALRARIEAAIADGPLEDLAARISSVELLETERETRTVSGMLPREGAAPEPYEALVGISHPARIRIGLREVTPDLFDRLAPLLGDGYLEGFDAAAHLDLPVGEVGEAVRARADELVPLAEHNPEIFFELRDDVRFHDGHPFDAGDVEFTYDAIMTPRNLSPRGSDFEPIKRVVVEGPHRVRVVYKRLFSPAVYPWSYMGMLPEHLLNEEAREREMDDRAIPADGRESFGLRQMRFTRSPVGTGAFRFVHWKTDNVIQLDRNDDYWDGPAEYESVSIRVIPDLLTQELEFRAGAIDLYPAQPHQVSRYRNDDAYQSFSAVGFNYSYIGYNARKPPFDDPRVRRALGMAIDVDQIIEYVLYGEGERVSGPYAIKTEWYDRSVEALPFDPEGAKRILAELGYTPNAEGFLERDGEVLEFNLITNNGNPQRKAIVTIAQNAWRRIGVKCNTRLIEWAVFLNDFVNVGEFDAVVLGWSTGLDADQYQIWHSSQTGPQQLNFVGYESEEVDELIEAIRVEYDRDQQRALAHRLHRVVAADQPYTFLYAARATQVLDKKIVMVERDASGAERFTPLRPTPTDQLMYYFRKWRKLDHVPDF